MFPLLIVVGMAALLFGVVFLTSERESPEALIAAIKTGSRTKRWQKAFELSNELNRGGALLRDAGLEREIIHILRDAAHYDAKTRGYMAAALRHFGGGESVAALRAALKDFDEEVRLHAMWALGRLGARAAAGDLRLLLKDPDERLRAMAAYVLGAIGDRDGIDALRALLRDPASDVRWNAALALARMGDDSGRGILSEMLNRELLVKSLALGPDKAEAIMMNAIKGISLVIDTDARARLERIARNDPSLRVRQAALDALRLPAGQAGASGVPAENGAGAGR